MLFPFRLAGIGLAAWLNPVSRKDRFGVGNRSPFVLSSQATWKSDAPIRHLFIFLFSCYGDAPAIKPAEWTPPLKMRHVIRIGSYGMR